MTALSQPVLVVDFGTSASSAALVGTDGTVRLLKEPVTGFWSWPSSVARHGDRLIVGTQAERRKKAAPEAYRPEFKRDLGQNAAIPLGDHNYGVHELIAAVLRAFGQQGATLAGGPVDRLVLTVPASYHPGDPRRDLMVKAGELAGFTEVELLIEPVAAAHALLPGPPLPAGSVVLVYDFGGGTFDAALVRLSGGEPPEILGHRALDDCGGRDIDGAVAEHLRSTGDAEMAAVLEPVGPGDTSLATLRMRLQIAAFARSVKHQLSEVQDVEDYLTPTAPPYLLHRRDLAELIAAQLQRTIACCHDLIDGCGVQLQDVDAVLLVGGSSRSPLVAEAVAAGLVDTIRRPDDPDLAVVLGAAVWAQEHGEPSTPAQPPTPGATPLRWDLDGGTATLLRRYVEPGQTYVAGSALALVRLGDGTLLHLNAPDQPGILLDWHTPVGGRVINGHWPTTITIISSEPATVAETATAMATGGDQPGEELERSMKFVAVTSCPTGITSYLAAGNLEQCGKDAGHEVRVETQGPDRRVPLNDAVIAAADAVIYAADLPVAKKERFAGKPSIDVGVQKAIHDGPGVISAAVAAAQTAKDLPPDKGVPPDKDVPPDKGVARPLPIPSTVQVVSQLARILLGTGPRGHGPSG